MLSDMLGLKEEISKVGEQVERDELIKLVIGTIE
jgi:hypothetical protein